MQLIVLLELSKTREYTTESDIVCVLYIYIYHQYTHFPNLIREMARSQVLHFVNLFLKMPTNRKTQYQSKILASQ